MINDISKSKDYSKAKPHKMPTCGVSFPSEWNKLRLIAYFSALPSHLSNCFFLSTVTYGCIYRQKINSPPGVSYTLTPFPPGTMKLLENLSR